MKSRIPRIIIGIIVFIFVSLIGGGYYFSSLVITPKVKGYDETYQLEIKRKRFTEAYFKSLPKEEVFIDSPGGYKIHAIYIPKLQSKKTIIFIHGHTFSLMGSFKYLDIFRKRGFNCLLIDNRFHGKSGGENSTFGYHERYDLKALVDWILAKTGKNSHVGFHGESLGSCICLMHAAIDNRAAFYILDGPIADLKELMETRLYEDFGLPGFPLIPMASLVSKLRGGMLLSEVSPIKIINQIKSPIFFIHGGADNYVPNKHSKRLYSAYTGKKKIWLCPGAGHSKSVIVNRSEYDRQVGDFLNEIGLSQ